MEKSELKQMLIEMGVNPVLAEMPCVIEPLYEKYKFQNRDEIKNIDKIQVGENGDCCQIFERQISLEKKGTVKILDDGLIHANKFGIETDYYTGSDLFIHSSTIRNRGLIEEDRTNEGTVVSVKGLKIDSGSWSIKKAGCVKIRGAYGKPLEFDEEMVLKEFDAQASAMIKDYPQTEQWYTETRKQLVEAIAREKDPLQRARLKAEALRKSTKSLKDDNNYLIRVSMLEAANLKQNLELLETVKNSPVGKVLFKRVIEEYEKLKEEKLNERKPTRFRVKSKGQRKSTFKEQESENESQRKLRELEQQELNALNLEIKSLERKYMYLSATNAELNCRRRNLSNKEYLTKKVVDKIRKSSSLKKLFIIGAVTKHKKQYSDETIYR